MDHDVIIISSDESQSVISNSVESLPSISDTELEFEQQRRDCAVDRNADSGVKSDESEMFAISSDTDDELFLPKAGKMKSDPEDLPKISFITRENRRLKNRFKLKRRRSYKFRDNYDDSDDLKTPKKEKPDAIYYELPRVTPLPELKLLYPDSDYGKPVECKSERKLSSVKRKRPSVEQLRSRQREILGDLFPVDKAVTILHNKKTPDKAFGHDRKVPNLDEAIDKSNGKSRAKHLSNPVKLRSNELQLSKFAPTSCEDEDFVSGDSRGSIISNRKKVKKVLKKSMSDSCNLGPKYKNNKKLKRSSSTDTPCNKVKVFSANSTRKVSDISDMGHLNCYPRVSLFDIFANLHKDTRENLNNITISMQDVNCPALNTLDEMEESLNLVDTVSPDKEQLSVNIVSTHKEQLRVNIVSPNEEQSSSNIVSPKDEQSSLIIISPQKELPSLNVSGSGSEQFNNDKISAVDTDVKTAVDHGTNTCTSFYSVKSDEFSDISEENDDFDSSVQLEKYKPDSDLMSAITHHAPMESNDCVYDEMPVLEEREIEKSATKCYSDEMPVLERFFVEFSSDFSANEEETLPDIEESKISDRTEAMSYCTTPKSSQKNGTSLVKPDNIFSMFSYGSQFPSCPSSNTSASNSSSSICSVISASTLTSTPSLPSSSSFLTSTSSVTSSASLVSCSKVLRPVPPPVSNECLSSPCLPNNPAISLKRKLGKKSFVPTSSFSLKSSNCSFSGPNRKVTSELTLSQQMDQLCLHLKDFVDLNEKDCLQKYYLPRNYKSLVDCFMENDVLDISEALDFIELLSKTHRIPSDICNIIIDSAFHSDTKLSQIHRSYKVLSTLLKERNGCFDVNWETIEKCLKVTLDNTSTSSDKHLLQSMLLLELSILMLKFDLYTRDLTDSREIRTSDAYKMLAYDTMASSWKSLIYYLNKALHAGQCTTSNRDLYKLPDVLLMLQDLFTLCVEVSSSCIDCANALSVEMVNTYKYLPSMKEKKRLIQSITSPLLQYKLVQKVLEVQYDGYQIVGWGLPESLEDIIQCFFKVLPLKNPMTPPTTPTDELHEGEGHFNTSYSPIDTEEIAMLCYYGVVSYLRASHDKSNMALRRRANMRSKKYREEDLELLSRMEEHVTDLEYHLRGMNSELTPETEHFLFLLTCLESLGM